MGRKIGEQMTKKTTTKEAHIRGIMKAQLYIQIHLDKPLSIEEVSKEAGFSPFHFHRVFKAFVKESLNGYIRRLRLEKAAGKLKYSEVNITDIALDSGYQSSSSFDKAFSQVMGESPKEYRKKHFGEFEENENQLRSEKVLKPEFVNLPKFDVFFVRAVGPYESVADIGWEKLHYFINKHKNSLSHCRKFSVAHDDPSITDAEKLRFDGCVCIPKDFEGDQTISRQTLGGTNYAQFIHKGSYETLKYYV